ncbi:MAG: hypothetical protein FIA82_08160 [Melioribacter sp.]|nr:hypothetical protein [Melioribacter sp.]
MDGIVGLQQILACDAGTLLTTPAGAVAMGFGKDKAFEETDFEPQTVYGNIKLVDFKKLLVSGLSSQPTMFMLKKSFDFLNGGGDLQVVTPKQNASTNSEDVMQFVGDYLLGLDFELSISQDVRTMKWIWERILEKAAALTFKDTWDSASIVSVAGVTDTDIEGKNYSYRRAPKMLAMEAPQGTSIALVDYQRLERKLTIKTKPIKNDQKQSLTNLYTVTLEIAGTGQQVADLVTLAGKAETPSVLIKEGNAGAYYDKFVIPAYKLGIGNEFKIGDDKRESRIKLEGDINIFAHSFAYGTNNGGAADDTTGITGGTMTIV